MKKFLIVFLVCLTFGCANEKLKQDETFKNPIFYKQLEPISKISRETFLTPTSIRYSNEPFYQKGVPPKEGWTEGKCKLLENEEDYIIMKCTYHNQKYMYDGATFVSKFSVTPGHGLSCKDGICQEQYVIEEDLNEKTGMVEGQSTYAVDMDIPRDK